ncbi:hypothetical protein [Gordonia hankookensis]
MVSAVGLVAAVLAVLAVPAAVLAGCSTYGQVSARAASTTPVTARVVDVLPADPTALDTGATVRWMHHGVTRTDTTSVPSTTRAGTMTRIWTDPTGTVVPQPPDRFGRVAGAAAVGCSDGSRSLPCCWPVYVCWATEWRAGTRIAGMSSGGRQAPPTAGRHTDPNIYGALVMVGAWQLPIGASRALTRSLTPSRRVLVQIKLVKSYGSASRPH